MPTQTAQKTQSAQAQPKASRRSQSRPQPVYSSSGRVYGQIEGRVLRKVVDAERHFLRKPPAIAFERYIFDAYSSQFDTLEVLDRATRVRWRVSRVEAEKRGFDPKRGYEPQVAVPMACWLIIPAYAGQAIPGPQADRPAPSVASAGPKTPATGSLFD